MIKTTLTAILALGLCVSAQAKVIIDEDFEGADPLAHWDVDECSSCGHDAVSIVTFDGDKAMKVRHESDDPQVSGGNRAEIAQDAPHQVKFRLESEWYVRYYIYIPSSTITDFATTSEWMVTFQWHGWPDYWPTSLDDYWRSPPASVELIDDAWQFYRRHDWGKISTNSPQTVTTQKYWGEVADGNDWDQWNKIEVWVRWSETNGYIKVEVNDVERLNVSDDIGYNDDVAPYLKFGIYMSDSFSSKNDGITAYYDDIYVERLSRDNKRMLIN